MSSSTASSFDVFIQKLRALPILPQPVSRGDRFAYGDLLITVLNPEEPDQPIPDHNSNSLVLLLEYRDVMFLFAGDIHASTEEVLGNIRLSDGCSVLKVADHGSNSSTSAEFLQWAGPELAVISCDSDDLSDRVAADLDSGDVPYLQTSSSGTIHVSTDGEAIWVSTDTLSEQIVGCSED